MKTPIRVCPGVHKIEEGTYLISGIITNPKDHNLERTLWGGKDYSQEYNDAGEEIKELEQELAYSPDSAYEAGEDEEDEEEDEEEDDDDDESEESCPENLVYSVDTADPEEKLEELYAEGYGDGEEDGYDRGYDDGWQEGCTYCYNKTIVNGSVLVEVSQDTLDGLVQMRIAELLYQGLEDKNLDEDRLDKLREMMGLDEDEDRGEDINYGHQRWPNSYQSEN